MGVSFAEEGDARDLERSGEVHGHRVHAEESSGEGDEGAEFVYF